MTDTKDWWRGALIYQIYPRSFLDSNGDGVGDLPGITEKLPYIKTLGAEGIWICPFYPSPMKDFGYDVSDYRAVDPLFGTMEDFKALLSRAHDLDLKIIIDLVLSHTSDLHPWFTESRSDKSGARGDWYVWADAKDDGGLPNNWRSVFGGPAWTFEHTRGQYYLHNFLSSQPDLNFHNPAVQEAALDTARFWLDLGVDGLRLDVVNFYFHDEALRDNPPRAVGTRYATQFEGEDPYSAQQHLFDKSRPEMLPFLERLRNLTDRYGAFMVGEVGDDFPHERAAEYTSGEGRLHTTYNTDLMAGRQKGLTATIIRAPYDAIADLPHAGWPSHAFSNHDVVRVASRWHPDEDGFGYNPALSCMLLALLGCLRGTVFLYQGEELGLPEASLEREALQDPWGIALWPAWQGRDGCRTPMPWTMQENAGFTSSGAAPWLPLAAAHRQLCVALQEQDPNSPLAFARRFFGWRKAQDILRRGDIVFIETGDEKLLAFRRSLKGRAIFCAFNLDGEAKILTKIFSGNDARKGEIFFENDARKIAGALELGPYGFLIAGE